jgi:hypothetical protein
MTNTHKTDNIQLLSIQNGKYFIKVKDLDIPITMDKYLYNKWFQETGGNLEDQNLDDD